MTDTQDQNRGASSANPHRYSSDHSQYHNSYRETASPSSSHGEWSSHEMYTFVPASNSGDRATIDAAVDTSDKALKIRLYEPEQIVKILATNEKFKVTSWEYRITENDYVYYLEDQYGNAYASNPVEEVKLGIPRPRQQRQGR